MTKPFKENESRGVTLVELMVAIVLLAIVVMFISLLPTLSAERTWRANMVSAATAAGRDKVEYFRSIVARTGPTYGGVDSLRKYWGTPSGNANPPDTFKQNDLKVVRWWRFYWTAAPPESGGRLRLRVTCIPMDGSVLSQRDSVAFETWIAKRDTLPII